MFDLFQKSLRNKLLLTFIFIGSIPFITLLIYTIYLSETKIVNKIIDEQYSKTKSMINQIDKELNSLTKEVDFIASLDVMDDILADDIDKKISRLLIKKSKDLNVKNSFIVVNRNSIVVSSSNIEDISKKINVKRIIKNSKSYIENNKLYIHKKIYASFNNKKEIAYLILKYDLNNFDIFLTHRVDRHSYIIDNKTNYFIGRYINFHLDFSKKNDSIITDEHLIVYKKMNGVLKDYYMVYGVDKEVALAFLHDFLNFMFYISIPIFLIIIFLSIKYAKGIVKPIEDLTYITDDITNTQNYSTRLTVHSKDEIATLTNSFNAMLKTTSTALSRLEKENKLRLKRFTQLIEVFNTIIQTMDEKECINTSLKQIKSLTTKTDLSFHKYKVANNTKLSIPLSVTDFENNKKIYFGIIELGLDKFDDINEEKFYNSIGAMISLQLDKIRLIDRTMSASRAKSAFISNMSHELRTPLNAIIGSTQFMITYEKLTDEQQDSIANIESSAHYLLEMINTILDIAKIEAGKIELHFKDINILELLQNSYMMLQPLADDKGVEFSLVYDNFENKLYKTDPKIFQQIVINLISNAIKFTEKGNIVIELYNDKNEVFVIVKDSGIGISSNDMELLFNDFAQVENIMQKKHKGTGLGLSLSKKMATILDGEVLLKSKGVNFGTTAIFSFKIR